MKQVVQDIRGGRTHLVAAPDPTPGPQEVLIATHASLLSAGTERSVVALAKRSPLGKARARPDQARALLAKVRREGVRQAAVQLGARLATPMPLGYSGAGTVLACGKDVTEFGPGDRVAFAGPHASRVAVGRRLCVRVPSGVALTDAAYAAVGAVALQGLRLAALGLGEHVLVVGLGLVGLLAVALARAQGARVLGVDRDPRKLPRARAMGAEVVCTAARADDVVAWAEGHGVDAALIATADADEGPMALCAGACAPRGRIVLLGTCALRLARPPFFEKELSFQVSHSLGPGRGDPAYEVLGQDYPRSQVRWTAQRNMAAVLGAIGRGDLDVAALTTHRVPLADVARAYRAIATPAAGAVGVLLLHRDAARPPSADADGVPSRAAGPSTGPRGVSAAMLMPASATRDVSAATWMPTSATHDVSTATRMPASATHDVSAATRMPASATRDVSAAMLMPTSAGAPELAVTAAAEATPAAEAPAPAPARLGVGLIGAGNYARLVWAPALARQANLDRRGVASGHGLHAAVLAERAGFAFAAGDGRAVIADPRTHAVLVATQHGDHADWVVRALQAGRHVLVEKPLAIDQAGLDAVAACVARLGRACPVLMVGLNRRFAPAVAALRQAFAAVHGPLTITYRFAVPALPRHAWPHCPRRGGGRLVGEACHAIDTCAALCGSDPVRVTAAAARPNGDAPGDDRATVLVAHADGSLSTILYDAGGSDHGPRETVEVAGGGRTGRCEDWGTVHLRGADGGRRPGRGDRGHRALLARFVAACRVGGPWPVPWSTVAAVAWATLAARQSLRDGSSLSREPAG